MKNLKQLYTSFISTEEFNDISPDGKTAEIEIAFSSDLEFTKFKREMKKSGVDSKIIYESPKLGAWFSPGDECKYDHTPYIDLSIDKQNWYYFIEFYRDYITKNNYVSSPRLRNDS